MMAVVFSVVVAGGVSDFTPTVRLELRTAVATQASVALSAVTLDVTPVTRLRELTEARLRELTESRLLELRRELQGSSVELTFTIAVESAAAAAAAMNALSPQFADVTTASTFLTTTSYTATVLTITSLPAAAYPPPSPPPPSPPQEESSIASTAMRVGIIIGWVCFGVVVLLLTCYCVNYFPPYAVNKVAPDQVVAGNVRSTLTQTTISNVKQPAVGLGQQGYDFLVGPRFARVAPEPASVPVAVSAAIPGDWPPTSYSRKGAVSPRGLYDHSQINVPAGVTAGQIFAVRPDGDRRRSTEIIVPAGVTAGQIFVVGGKHYVALPRGRAGRRARVSPSVGRLPPIITTRWDGPTQAVEPDGHVLHRRRLPPISTPY
jgi:hypothetical protein